MAFVHCFVTVCFILLDSWPATCVSFPWSSFSFRHSRVYCRGPFIPRPKERKRESVCERERERVRETERECDGESDGEGGRDGESEGCGHARRDART